MLQFWHCRRYGRERGSASAPPGATLRRNRELALRSRSCMPGAIVVCVDSCSGGGVDTGGGCGHAGVGPGAPALACGAGDACAAIPVAGDNSERVGSCTVLPSAWALQPSVTLQLLPAVMPVVMMVLELD